MPVRRARPLPVVSVPRSTLLNGQLSPTSRLLYVVLLASLDGDVDLDAVASLVGVADANALKPFLEELTSVGAVDLLQHLGQGEILTVHEMPLLPDQRSHPCVACEACGECSCEHTKGLCQRCDNVQRAFAEAERDIARWKSQLAAGATYALGQRASRLHRWDCSTLNNPEKGLAQLEEAKPYEPRGALSWPQLPLLYTAEELRAKGTRKKHCANCGPDPL